MALLCAQVRSLPRRRDSAIDTRRDVRVAVVEKERPAYAAEARPEEGAHVVRPRLRRRPVDFDRGLPCDYCGCDRRLHLGNCVGVAGRGRPEFAGRRRGAADV